MTTAILVLPSETTLATALIPTIAVVDAGITTATQVLAGCVTVGLNRLLSTYTFPHTTPATKLINAMALVHVAAADTYNVVVSAADAARINTVHLSIEGLQTTADITCAAARTGLALLLGLDVTLPPLRTP